MKWNNLKSNKCPKCGKNLMDDFETRDVMIPMTRDPLRGFYCDCGFSISVKRFKEITISQVNRDLDKYHEDMEEERKNWD